MTEKVCDHCYFSVIMCVVVVVGVVGVWGGDVEECVEEGVEKDRVLTCFSQHHP